MPIVNCFVNLSIKSLDLDSVVASWSEMAEINPKDITINLIELTSQSGNPYPMLVNLYLPTLWSNEQMHKITITLALSMQKTLGLEKEHIFIMTHWVDSGQVFENGEIINW